MFCEKNKVPILISLLWLKYQNKTSDVRGAAWTETEAANSPSSPTHPWRSPCDRGAAFVTQPVSSWLWSHAELQSAHGTPWHINVSEKKFDLLSLKENLVASCRIYLFATRTPSTSNSDKNSDKLISKRAVYFPLSHTDQSSEEQHFLRMLLFVPSSIRSTRLSLPEQQRLTEELCFIFFSFTHDTVWLHSMLEVCANADLLFCFVSFKFRM